VWLKVCVCVFNNIDWKGWDCSRVIDDAENRDGCMESSMGGVLDSIDLDAFLDSIHATSNH
jgi:hypothetical protein